MKHSIKYLILFALVCILERNALGQNPSTCKQYIEKYMARMSSYAMPKDNQYYYLDMDVTTIPNENSSYAQTSLSSKDIDVKILVGNRMMYYKSKYLDIYSDLQNTFTVIYPQKLILWSKLSADYQANVDKQAQMNQVFSERQRELVKKARLASCQDTVFQGVKSKKIILIPDKEEQNR
ncbi:MAG: hypothetical protein AAFU64_06315, partial [Bacteroidota bacterium]